MQQKHNRVGLGTFPLASVFSKISKSDAKDVVRKFVNSGGYYIDTAPLYGFGKVEELLGEVLKEFSRDKYYIVTKCNYIDVEGKTFKTVQKSGKYKDVIRECGLSLKRLGVEYIDLYFSHGVDPNTPKDETMGALEKLQEEGKIKTIGVSNVNLEELKEYNKNGNVRFVQNRFSLINQSIDDEFQKYMIKHNIKLVPYQVIDRGQLTGSVIDGIKFEKGDLRVGNSDWEQNQYNTIADWSKEQLLPISKEIGCTLGQLTMAWALHQPYMGFLIVGVTSPKYIPINLKTNNISLSVENLKEISSAYSNLEKKIKKDFGMTVREFRGLNEKYY